MEFNGPTNYCRVSLSLSPVATEILNFKNPMDAPQTPFSGRGRAPTKKVECARDLGDSTSPVLLSPGIGATGGRGRKLVEAGGSLSCQCAECKGTAASSQLWEQVPSCFPSGHAQGGLWPHPQRPQSSTRCLAEAPTTPGHDVQPDLSTRTGPWEARWGSGVCTWFDSLLSQQSLYRHVTLSCRPPDAAG